MGARIGVLILVVVVAVVAGYQFLWGGGPVGPVGGARPGPAVTVRGLIGGEKSGLLASPEVQKILRERYGLTVDATAAGSLEMVGGPVSGKDFLWPSSQIALELYRQKGGDVSRAEVLFNSPIVLYSRKVVTDALVKARIVAKTGDAYYVVDFPKLIELVNEGQNWKQLGLPQLYGKVMIHCTDPSRSNSGSMFAGLLANMLNGGEVVDEASIEKVLPAVKRFFARQGYMQHTSSVLFSQFLQQGVGSYPIIAGYEAQLVEFSLQNAQYRDLLRQEITTLYPKPTAWSSHPLIALTPGGERLLAAFRDKDLQRLAWEKHGFRTGLMGVQNDPKVLEVIGVPATVEAVIPMPTPAVMATLTDAVSAGSR